jgi:hypothetical protein
MTSRSRMVARPSSPETFARPRPPPGAFHPLVGYRKDKRQRSQILVVGQFAVAALGACPAPCGERRNLLNQKPAVASCVSAGSDRRYKEPK